MSAQLDDTDWIAAAECLRRHDDIVLACHIHPDGDALGSMLALGLALQRSGKRVQASFSEPFDVPVVMKFLPGLDLLVAPEKIPAAPSLMVSLDAGSVARLGTLADRVAAADECLVIDHHASNDGFGSLQLIDPSVPGTVVLVGELLDRMGIALDRDIATCLYTGLITDTGLFRYPTVNAAVHEFAGRLLATGIAHYEIARDVFDTTSFACLTLAGQVLSRAQLDETGAGGNGVVWSSVSADERIRYGVPYPELEMFINLLRTTGEADVAVLVKQAPDGRWSVSTRSRGKTNVGRVCTRLGGGGHDLAAGFTSDLDLDGTVKSVLAALAVSGNGD